MKHAGYSSSWRRAAVLVAALAAGCAASPPAAVPEGATVKPVERAGWNAQPEAGLYRITWDARRSKEIRARSEFVNPAGSENPYFDERWQLDVEADRELKARGLCTDGSALLHSVLDAGGSSGEIIAVFKCRPTLF